MWICPQLPCKVTFRIFINCITFDCQQAYNPSTLNHSLWVYGGKNETSMFPMLYWFLLHRCSRNVSYGDEGFRNVCFQGPKFQTSRGDQVFWLSCCWLFVPKLPLDNGLGFRAKQFAYTISVLHHLMYTCWRYNEAPLK